MSDQKRDIAFELDIDKLLAYFAIGCKAIAGDNGVFFNGGIVDYDPNAEPGSKTKMKFDFKGPTSTYEICYMPTPAPTIEIGITEEEKKHLIDTASISTKDDQTIDQAKIDATDDEIKKIEEKRNEFKANFNKRVTEEIKAYEIKYRDGNAFNFLKDYLKNFGGKANASKLKKTDIEICYLPDDLWKGGPEKQKSYKDFKIQSEKDRLKLAKKRYNDWREAALKEWNKTKEQKTTIKLEGLAFKIKVTMTILTK